MTTSAPLSPPNWQRSHTRCPQCHASFFVSPLQLKQGNGFIRCNRCFKLFFGQENQLNEAQCTIRSIAGVPTETSTKPDLVAMSKSVLNITPMLPSVAQNSFRGLCPPARNTVPAPTSTYSPPVHLEVVSNTFTINEIKEEEPKEEPITPDIEIIVEAITAETFEAVAVTQILDIETATPITSVVETAEPAPALPSFAAITHDDSPRPSPAVAKPNVLWIGLQNALDILASSLVIASLWLWQCLLKLYHLLSPRTWLNLATTATVCLLMANALWWQRDRLAEIPALRPTMEAACHWLACTLPPYKDPQKILVQNRVLETHPFIQGGLRLHAIIRNESPFPQPFANVALYFYDPNGHWVASRQFRPQDYVESVNGKLPLMPPHTPIQLTLDMPDPGKQATGFMLAFQ